MTNTNRRFARLAAALILASIGAGCAKEPPLEPVVEDSASMHVLFIGNSLTYVNALPVMVSQISYENGYSIATSSVAFPDFALIDHINEGTSLHTIASRHWDVVVLQQGPSTLDTSHEELVQWTQMFEPYIRAAGARPALYMVWPDSTRVSFMSATHASYSDAANSVNGYFYPAGDAWTLAWQADPSLALYGPDNLHPSALGTTLAALVIAEQLSGGDARTFKKERLASSLGVSAAKIGLLETAAHNANMLYAHQLF